MAKLLVSFKFVFFSVYTASLTGFGNVLSILTQGNPPIIFYYFGMSTICSIPWVVLIKDIRTWVFRGHEYYEVKKIGDNYVERVRNDVRGLLITFLSLLCIMFLGIGYLNQIFYKEINFSDYDKALLVIGAGGLQGLGAFLSKVSISKN